MSNDAIRCESDYVYLGLTRPPMLHGVTDVYLVFMSVAVMMIFLGFGGIRGILYSVAAAPALYVFGYALCEKDARIFQIWGVRLANFSQAQRRASYWGGNSFDPAAPAQSAGVGRG